MIYGNIYEGIFISRPNRFIAHVEIDGKTEICHVKNTGRCKELLIPGVKVYLNKPDNPGQPKALHLKKTMSHFSLTHRPNGELSTCKSWLNA